MNNDEHAIQIVKLNGDHFELNIEELKSILLSDEIKKIAVVVFSIVGYFRGGKTFILNYFLQFLQSECNDEWIGDISPDNKFSWRSGTKRETTGIFIWSKPFIMEFNGKKFAVILMDTQGISDPESSMKDCATIFAFSTIVSSIQDENLIFSINKYYFNFIVYNLHRHIRECDLDVLNYFVDYGLLVLSNMTDVTPLQKLMFLIRDWQLSDGLKYGLQGGNDLLKEAFEINRKQTDSMVKMRHNRKKCFTNIDCFLMPHPGMNVTDNNEFKGELSDINPNFIEQLKVLVPLLLSPSKLIEKKIGGQVITGKDLFNYMNRYFEKFSGGELPELNSLLTITAEFNNSKAMETAIKLYDLSMKKLFQNHKFIRNIEGKHKKYMNDALDSFDKKCKMGGREYSDRYRQQLQNELENAFSHYAVTNIRNRGLFDKIKSCCCPCCN